MARQTAKPVLNAVLMLLTLRAAALAGDALSLPSRLPSNSSSAVGACPGETLRSFREIEVCVSRLQTSPEGLEESKSLYKHSLGNLVRSSAGMRRQCKSMLQSVVLFCLRAAMRSTDPDPTNFFEKMQEDLKRDTVFMQALATNHLGQMAPYYWWDAGSIYYACKGNLFSAAIRTEQPEAVSGSFTAA